MSTTDQPGASITIAVNQFAWDAVDVFDDLLDAFEALGLSPHVQSPRNGNYSRGGVVVDETVAVTILVGATLGRAALAALEDVAREFFTRKLRNAAGLNDAEPEYIEIYGPSGETLSEVKISDTPPPRSARRAKRKSKKRGR